VLTVTDDGTGLPADFDPASSPGFGMKMISALAGQLGGELRFCDASSASGPNFSTHVAKIPTARNLEHALQFDPDAHCANGHNELASLSTARLTAIL
jgi:two-component sensor histidine kinase